MQLSRWYLRDASAGYEAASKALHVAPPLANHKLLSTLSLGSLPPSRRHDFGVTSVRIMALVLGACSAFFVFYEVRLLVVTHLLQHLRSGGQGAYIGAVAFPLIALALGLAARAAWRRITP